MSYIQAHLRDRPHFVYRIFDETDTLLYIGCTSKHPATRIVTLRSENPVVGAAPLHHWTAELFVDGPTAEAHEGRLIDELSPPYNRHRSALNNRKRTSRQRALQRITGEVPPREPRPSWAEVST